MKILLIHENHPDEVRLGGTERYMIDIAEELTKVGHDVYIFTLSGHLHHRRKNTYIDYSKHETSHRGDKKYPDLYTFHIASANHLAYHLCRILFYNDMYRSLRDLIRHIKPDVIHLQNNYEYSITILASLWNQKVVQTIHDYTIIYPTAMCTHKQSCAGQSIILALKHGCTSWKRLIATGWFRYNRRFIDRHFVNQFIAPSRDLALRLRKCGYGSVIHLPNFTSLKPIVSTTPKRRRVVLYVGSLVAHKGIDILLRAYALIQSEVEDIALWIVGEGPAENDLKYLAEELKLHNVTFLGLPNHNDLSVIYNQSSVVVIPSLWFENSPLVAYEAMAHARPILATRIGGLPELVIDGKNGYLFRRGNAAELAHKMHSILTDDTLAQSLSNGSRYQLAMMDTVEDHVQHLVKIYEHIKK